MWFIPHVIISVITYSLVTLAAIAGVSVTLKQRVLKKSFLSIWLYSNNVLQFGGEKACTQVHDPQPVSANQ